MTMVSFLTEHHRPARRDLLVLKRSNSLRSCITVFFQAEVDQPNRTGNVEHLTFVFWEAVALKIYGFTHKFVELKKKK